jgi:hypothetical protein
MKKNLLTPALISLFSITAVSLHAQTLWTGPSGGDWNTSGNWDNNVPTLTTGANFSNNSALTVNVSSASDVQGIQKGGTGSLLIQGSDLTLGNGYTDSFNSILVNAADVTIDNNLINTQNKRITLNSTGNSLTLNGNINTGGVTTQIGNLGSGTLTFNGDRTGGNTLILREGVINTTGILSNSGGGSTTVQSSGTVISANTSAPAIQSGSLGLVLSSTGTFRFGADNQIGGFLNLNGGTLDLDSFSNGSLTIGNMQLNATSTIDFSDLANSSIVFADLSATSWNAGASLNIVGFGAGDSLRFGTDASGLTPTQLSQLFVNGNGATIDSSGFVTAIPEPASAGLLLSAIAAACLLSRRKLPRD